MRRFSFLFGILAAGALLSAACEQKTATPAAGTAEKALPPLTALPGSAFNVEWTRPAIPSSVPCLGALGRRRDRPRPGRGSRPRARVRVDWGPHRSRV